MTSEAQETSDPKNGPPSIETSPASLQKLGGWLAGSFTAITAVLTTIGVAAGDIQRVLRNQPAQAVLWLGLLGVGIIAGAIVWHLDGTESKQLKGWDLLLATLGVAVIGLAAVWPVVAPSDGLVWRDEIGVAILIAAAVVALIYALLRLLRWLSLIWQPLGPAVKGLDSLARLARLDPIFGARGPWVVLATVVLVVVAAAFEVSLRGAVLIAGIWSLALSVFVKGNQPAIRRSAGLLIVGFLSFAVGVAGFLLLIVDNTSSKDRPTVAATLTRDQEGLVLSTSISASGLQINEHVVVAVEALNSGVQLSDVSAGPGARTRDRLLSVVGATEALDSAQILHLSRVGADDNGDVASELTVPLSSGLYERVRVTAFLSSPGADDLFSQLEAANLKVHNETTLQSENTRAILADLQGPDQEIASFLLAASGQASSQQELGLFEAAEGLQSKADDADSLSAWRNAVTEYGDARLAQQEAFVSLSVANLDEEELEDQELSAVKAASELMGARPKGRTPDGDARSDLTEKLNDAALSEAATRRSDYEAFLKAARSLLASYEVASLALTYPPEGFDDSNAPLVVEELARRTIVEELITDVDRLEEAILTQRQAAEQCNPAVQRSGCALLLLPELQVRPSLALNLATTDGETQVQALVKATELAASDHVYVVIHIGSGPTVAQPSLTALLGPSPTGLIDETLTLPLDPEARYVCATAELIRTVITRPTNARGDGTDSSDACTSVLPNRSHVELTIPVPTTTTTTTTTTTAPPIMMTTTTSDPD